MNASVKTNLFEYNNIFQVVQMKVCSQFCIFNKIAKSFLFPEILLRKIDIPFAESEIFLWGTFRAHYFSFAFFLPPSRSKAIVI